MTALGQERTFRAVGFVRFVPIAGGKAFGCMVWSIRAKAAPRRSKPRLEGRFITPSEGLVCSVGSSTLRALFGEATMAASKKLTSGQKAAQTRKRRAAGRKAAATRKRNATAAKAAATRKKNRKT
jgi:hypothetical protein